MENVLETLIHLKDLLSHHPMFAAGLLLMMGYLIGKLAAKVKLPEITGYIVAGLLVSESVTGIFPAHMNESFKIITEVALGLIALTIGAEFSVAKLRRIGRAAVIITLVQISMTFVSVSLGLVLFGMDLPFAVLLGAVATATAPAATVAVVQALRARGRFVDYLYSIVALDDAGCVILFGLVFAFTAQLFGKTGVEENGGLEVARTLGEVLFSVLIGVVAGYILHKMTRNKVGTNEIMIVSLSIIFISTGFAIVLHLSPLLTSMTAGCVLVNLSARNHRLFRILEPITPPLYALFFVIAGTELKPDVIMRSDILLFGAVFVAARGIGKYGGVWAGCALSGIGKPIRGCLGWCMLPQAGVAIGLVLLIQASPLMHGLDPEQKAIIHNMVNIVLLSVFVNELIGPPISKMAIIRGNQMEERT